MCNMKTLEKLIPYCGNCSRKIKKESLGKNEYYCDVVKDTPMKGVVTFDTDGTHCTELGIYESYQQNRWTINFKQLCVYKNI